MKRVLIFTLLVLSLMSLNSELVFADNNYRVTPRVIDREVMPRDIFTETVTITNNKSHQIHVYPSVNRVDIDDGGDIAAFTPPSVSDNSITPTSWIAITRSRVSVQPGQSKEVPVHFKIHPQAVPGVYHVFIGFGHGNNQPTAEKMARNGQAPGIVVTLSVDQKQTEFLKLGKFIVDRFVTKPENSGITYTLENPGSAEVTPKGEIIFSNTKGEEVAAVTINPDQESLTPGQKTTYTIDAPSDGMFGKYKAFLSVDYGTEQLASVYDTAFFYVIPWQKLLIIFIILLVLAIALTLIIHNKLHKGEYDGSDEIPLYVKDGVSDDKEHDINLKT